MATYADLQPGNFYLLKDAQDTDIEMVSVLALTDKCILLRSFGQVEEDFWKKRTDSIEEIVEELDYESASAILSLYDEEEEEEDWEEEDE
ncbi:hypothetical protein [Flavihumibacter sp. CACIAM 22H1]|uniref:hypothetical protein n=1 Tax=Flavihumibacter sp. CACIAM 22H1 TaxID=1812911 RepID=UPI0007A86023|nr:hypothetical protein [Flavihumibacter sp. CACIAM 22H1]KYP13273.1 MAG: hypothetical protein A1D16_09920 [Flavihumibacter sp. CACIAM 22H1]